MSVADPPERSAVATFGAVGDIALAGPTAEAMRRNGLCWPFAEADEILSRADVLFGNLESPFLPPGFPPDAVDPRGLTSMLNGSGALRAAGFDVVSLANNHILDGGTVSMSHTAAALSAAGIGHAGTGLDQRAARQPFVLNRSGMDWAFLCYAEDSNYTLSTSGPCHAYYEPDSVIDDVTSIRGDVDVVVVSIHADLEFMETPSPARREAFRCFARAGATLVLGHHPHVPQGVERVGSSLVAYSLGNFVFHARTSPYLSAYLPATAWSFVLLAEVTREGVGQFDRVPIVIGEAPAERPTPASGKQGKELESYFRTLDAGAVDDSVVAANWRRAAMQRLESCTRALATINDPTVLVSEVGRLLHVAENRAWVNEIVAASGEVWDEQRVWTDVYHRPSYATQRTVRRGVLARVRAGMRNVLRTVTHAARAGGSRVGP